MQTNKTPSRDSVKRKMYKMTSEVLTLNTTFDAIPMAEIMQAIESAGAMVVQEDGTRWEGMLMGNNSGATFEVTCPEFKKPFYMHLSWYKREFSGRYEITLYFS